MKTFNPKPIFRGSSFGNFHNPERKIDTGVIETVFGVVRSGNYNEIKKVISEQNTTFNLTNNDNENLLHVIIKNDNEEMNEDQKYELIEYLINNGVSISGFDKNNITPLHLASKYQLPKIVDILLKSGADPNASDDQYMTPIHYITQGNIIECKSEKKLKAIIPKSTINTSANPNNEFKKVTTNIIDLLNEDNLRKYTTHIKRSIMNIKNIYIDEFREIDNKYKNKIGNVLSDKTSTSVEKEQEISRIMNDTVNQIRDNLKEKLRSNLIEAKIKPDQSDSGWGPEDNIKVLPNTKEILLNNIKRIFLKNKIDTFENLDNGFKDIYENTLLLHKEVSEIIDKMDAVHKIFYFYSFNNNNIPFNPIKILDTYIDNEDEIVRKQEININDDVDPNNLYIPEKDIDRIELYRVKREDRQKLKKSKKLTQKFPLTLDPPNQNTTGLNTNPKNFGYKLKDLLKVKLPTTDKNFNNIAKNIRQYYNKLILNDPKNNHNTKRYWRISKLFFATNRIIGTIRLIYLNFSKLKETIQNENKFHQSYHKLLTEIVFSIVNIYQYLDFAKKSIRESNLTNKLRELKNTFDIAIDNNEGNQYLFALEYCSEYLENIINSLSDVYENKLNKLFEYFYTFHTNLNEFIKLINEISAEKYIDSYFNNKKNINNIYDRNILKLSIPISNNLDKYINSYNIFNDLSEKKIKLIEDFIPTVNNYNYQTFYGSVIDSVEIYPSNFNNMFKEKPSSNSNPRIGYLSLTNIPNDTKLSETKSTHKDDLLDANNNKIGLIGFENNFFQLKAENSALSSVNIYLDNHIYLVKNLLIEKIIEEFAKTNNDIKDKLLERIKIYGINEDKQNKAVFYTIIGKITDELVRNVIDYSIQKVSIEIVNGITNSDDFVKFAPEPITKGLDGFVLNIDTGFQLKFNQLFDELTNKFLNQSNSKADNEDYIRLRYTTPLVEEQIKDGNQHKIFSINYTGNVSNIIEECYNIKPEIIDKLVNRNGNINAQDFVKQTPLYYAIATLYPDMVRKIINRGGTVHNSHTKNNSGVTPLIYGINLYRQHISYIYNKNDFLDKIYKPLYKDIKDNIQSKPDYGNNIIKHLELAFPQLLVMYNNMFYLNMKNNINDWNFNDTKKIANILLKYNIITNKDILSDKVYLLEGDLSSILKHGDSRNVLISKKEELEEKLKQKEYKYKEKQFRISNIDRELDYLKKKNINTSKESLIKERSSIKKEIDELNKDISQLKEYNQKYTDTFKIDLNKEIEKFVLPDVNSVDDIYNTIFNMINVSKVNDYMLYNKLWDSYVSDNKKLINMHNIHMSLVKLQSELLNMIIKNKVSNGITDDINSITKVYDDIFYFTIKNYRDLPQEYNINSNKPLSDTIDIIAHIIKHIVCSNLYLAITKTVLAYIRSLAPSDINIGTNPGESNDKFISNVTDKVIEDYNEKGLHDYIIKKMPLIITKTQLGIFEDEFDEDRNTSLDVLFDNIINIMKNTSIIPVNSEDSKLLSSFRNYLVPYYKDIFAQLPPALKNLTDNYNNYIINEKQYINVIKELVKGYEEQNI